MYPISRLHTFAFVLVLCAGVASAQSDPTPRYTFSWPIGSDAPAPRGGTTKGAPVEPITQPSESWQALQSPGLSSLERDRRAVLAMAGTYRVTFDFIEPVSFGSPSERPRPYQSWGTERVFVDVDEPHRISLVHILEMRFAQKDGSISEPMVTRHWRQEWRYEPREIITYSGRERWVRAALKRSDTKGTWSQTVYQVDESPRYASVGAWTHTPSFSTWISADTRRPLPRREWSIRKDYDVLIGTNRHTILPTGWVHEENNLKAVLDADRSNNATRPYVGREYGVARYERIRDELSAARAYYESTREFWTQVLAAWNDAFDRHGRITLEGQVDQNDYFMPLFERAAEIESSSREGAVANSAATRQRNSEIIRETLTTMGVP